MILAATAQMTADRASWIHRGGSVHVIGRRVLNDRLDQVRIHGFASARTRAERDHDSTFELPTIDMIAGAERSRAPPIIPKSLRPCPTPWLDGSNDERCAGAGLGM